MGALSERARCLTWAFPNMVLDFIVFVFIVSGICEGAEVATDALVLEVEVGTSIGSILVF